VTRACALAQATVRTFRVGPSGFLSVALQVKRWQVRRAPEFVEFSRPFQHLNRGYLLLPRAYAARKLHSPEATASGRSYRSQTMLDKKSSAAVLTTATAAAFSARTRLLLCGRA